MTSSREVTPHVFPSPANLLPLDASQLAAGQVTDFDVYLNVNGTVALFAPAPYLWTAGELARLMQDGRGTLYYDIADARKVEAAKRISTIAPIDVSLPPRQRLGKITDAAAELTRVLYEYPFSEASLAKGKEIAEKLVHCVGEDVQCLLALGKLANHHDYTYYHSSRTAAYAIALAMQMGERDPERLTDIALGALLHDVGKSKIDLAILNKPGPLTAEEWERMKRHPEYGHGLIAPSLLSHVPLEIVLHHHERMDGKGYPHALGQGEILPEVRIAGFADLFDALTTNRPYQQSRTRFEALDFIRFKLLSQIDPEVYRAMVALLRDEELDKAQDSQKKESP